MSKLISIFGDLASSTNLQLVINNNLDVFAPTWFSKYFTWGPIQSTLTYVSVIGATRIEAAASVVNRDSKTPLRARPNLSKLQGEIPAIKESFKMKESDYREFMAVQAILGLTDSAKKSQMMEFIWGDTKRVAESTDKRIDMMCLQGISTGKIKINSTTNPDGLVMDDIDLLMPDANKSNSAVTWANAAATPLTVDIPTIVKAAKAKGIVFSKILMTSELWWQFAAITEVKNLLSNYLGFKQSGTILATLDNVNSFLAANKYPVIELVDEVIGVEKDGVITSINPFDVNNATFIPAGPLGTIKNALAIEKFRPVEKVSYADRNRTLISKWSENEPFGEWTKGELNAFPSFDAIDSMYILTAVHA